MKYYVVADVHGYYTYLREALENAGFFEEAEPHKLVVCGDLLDRGNETNQVIDFVLKLACEDKLIYIRGNHEDIFCDCLRDITRGYIHEIASGMKFAYESNGTWDTMLNISGMSDKEAYANPSELVKRIRESAFFRYLLPRAIDYYETERYIFTHGWIPCRYVGYSRAMADYTYDAAWRDGDEKAWIDARWFNGISAACKNKATVPDKTVVCGHFNASYGHCKFEGNGPQIGAGAIHTPFYAEGIIAIDAYTPISRMINCIVVED